MAFGQFSAQLISSKVIRIILYSDKYQYELNRITIFDEHEEFVPFSLLTKSQQFKITTIELELEKPFVLGQKYSVFLHNFGHAILNVNEATSFPGFDEEYYYDGPLGTFYTPQETCFKLWAPLASRVTLKYSFDKKTYHYVALKRGEKGVFCASVSGDLEGVNYTYIIENNGVLVEVVDPYAISSGPNGTMSYVIDLAKTKLNLHEDKLPPFKKKTEAIIYETSVRDQTNDERTTIVDRATFAGMIEENRLIKGVYPVGFDYLKTLGFTHLQLMPVMDFKTVDELDKWRDYNWGYDPHQFFVLEGSYARDPSDPYNRILDFKGMVARFHEEGIRIVMDVVFNHVYEYETSIFEKIVPNYYFRKTEDGVISNGSGVGNDLASERKMVRKLILDACNFYISELGVDGFRFDLMGLLDCDTMLEIERLALSLKPDFIVYGEGWQMSTTLASNELAHHGNASRLPGLSFFNDSFREIVKGPSFHDQLYERGYLLGATHYRDGFPYAYSGSVLNSVFSPRFKDASQSINYVECHDNGVLIDKLAISNASEPLETHLMRLKAINAITMLSFGIPFFHRGQEIGVSKYGDLNSYKSSDKVNQFPYTLAYKRSEMVEYFKALCALRKECLFLHESDPSVIKDFVSFNALEKGAMEIVYNPDFRLSPYREFHVYVNPTSDTVFVDLKHPLKIILNRAGYIAARSKEYIERAMVAPYSVIVLGLREGDFGPK